MRFITHLNKFLFIFIFIFSLYECSPETVVIEKPKPPPVNLIWIVIDSLRADIIGKYGVTPELDNFAKTSHVFTKHLVNAAWTRPSTLVFFTGKYASRSPVNFWDYPTPKSEATAFYQKELYPLPKYLSQNGIRTIMIGNNPFLTDKKGLGVDVGFDEIYDYSEYSTDTPKITKKSKEVLGELIQKQQPYFLFLNFNDPHKPYTPPVGYTTRIKTDEILDERKRDYIGEVAYIDDQLADIFDFLKKSDHWENTVILITADHGEVMRPEHAISPFTGTNTFYGHGQDLFLENIHVPLFVKQKQQKSSKVYNSITQSVDLYPFVLDVFLLENKSKLDGISLTKVMNGEVDKNRIYYGETRSTQGVGLGADFLLQKSFRFHEPGKFWAGVVGKEIYYFYNTVHDPYQINPIRFSDLNELKELPISKENQDKISFLWQKLRDTEPTIPIYTIRFLKNGTDFKNLEARVQIDIGQIRVKNPEQNPNLLISNSSRNLTLSLNTKHLKAGESFEFSFEVYPDVTFPKFDFFEDGVDVSNRAVGIGMFDLAPNSCMNDCNPLYEAPFLKPKISLINQFQVWKTGGILNQYTRETKLETDAMEILKKQGYVQ